ncbi:nuclear receptor subfamily 2 group E member tailless [Lycorma delicatula]|uniref:nuclear receptor subfamily 2 group E member tailless n=1 Tax=Lycorma delicatula TaxID=130591 RepID=UPI003F51214C
MKGPINWLSIRSRQNITESRILYDIPCKVCQDHSSGKHYGIFACDGCAGFFKRSIRRNRQYVCKAKCEGTCIVDKTHRNQCRACRLRKCVQAGMNKDAVQHERGPRNSTLRRQMALYLKEGDPGPSAAPVLDLALPKTANSTPPRSAPPPHLPPPPTFLPSPAHIHKTPLSAPTGFSGTEEVICESAARLLFMNVKWAKHVPAFTALPLSDQLMLLEQSWGELFVLGAAQFLPPFSFNPLLSAASELVSNSSNILQEVTAFQENLAKLRQLHLDPHEYACLRAIVLFKTGLEGNSSDSDRRLQESSTVSALQDHTQLMLNKYISTAHPTQPFRFGKLLLLLPNLRTVSATTIEELFFRRTIGHIPIERIICDMYKANDL